MSSAARFLLEFEATGDQEVVNKIKAVGAAGKQAATDLESLRGIQDPFEPIATGADAAIAPIEGVGTAAEGTVTPMTDMGSATDDTVSVLEGAGTATGDFSANLDAVGGAADAATGGLTSANTVVGDFGSATATTGESVAGMAGQIGAMGGIIGSVVTSVFSMSNAQLALDRANLKAAKSAETARKAEDAFNKLLGTAKGNAAGVAQARDDLTAAQGRLNDMQEAGITSGAEYEAAQADVAAATESLRAAFVAGGGDAAKFDTALNKVNLSTETASINARNAAKEANEFNQNLLNLGFGAAALVSQTVSMVSGLGKFRDNAKSLGGAIKGLLGSGGIGGMITKLPTATGLLGELGPIGIAVYDAFALAGGAISLFQGFVAAAAGEAEKASKKFMEAFDFGKIFQSIGPSMGVLVDVFKVFGVDVDKEMKKAIDALLGLGKQTKETAKDTKEMGVAAKDQATSLKEAVTAAKGNTTAFEALQRTNEQAKITQEDFNAAMEQGKGATADLTDEVANMNDALTDIESAMSMSADSALNLSNLFPQMGENINNALLGQEQGLDVAIQLWNEFNRRVQEGQYEVGEFTKFITDMGYEIPPAVQGGIDALTEQQQVISDAAATIPDYVAGIQSMVDAQNEMMGQKFDEELNKIIDPALETAKRIEAIAKAEDEAKASGDKWADSLRLQATEMQSMIDAMQKVENQEQGVNNALLKTTLTLEESNQKLREARAVRDDAAASANVLHEALNKELTSLIEEEAALKASIAAATDSEIQTQKLANAKLEGQKAAAEFIAALDEEVAQQQAYEGALRTTVRALGTFGDASVQTAEQLEQFLQVAAGSPEALAGLAQELGGLAQEATKFVEFAGEEDELFGNWKIAKDIPEQIEDMMGDADWAFIEGRAQLERSLEYLGPLFGVKAARALQEGSSTALAGLRDFGNQAADIVRGSVDQMSPAVQELATAFDALGEPGENTINSLQRVVTAMENAQDPAADLRLAMADLAVQSGSGAEQVAAMAGGLDLLRSSAANAGKPLEDVVLSMEKMNTTTIKETGQVFGEINGQMVELKPAAEGAAGGLAKIDVNATAAATKLKALHTVLTLLPLVEVAPKINVDTTQAAAKLQATKTALEILNNATVTPKIDVDAEAAASKIQSTASALQILHNAAIVVKVTADVSQAKAALASLPKPAPVTLTYKIVTVGTPPVAKPITTTITYNYKIVGNPPKPLDIKKLIKYTYKIVGKAPNPPEIKKFISYKYRITNKIPNPPEIKRFITYRYRVTGSRPNPPNLNRTITYRYRTVGSRPAQFGMHENLAQDTMIAAHKGERVDITPGASAGNTTRTVESAARGSRIASEVVIPVTLTLDNKVLIRTVRRGLVEEVSGTM